MRPMGQRQSLSPARALEWLPGEAGPLSPGDTWEHRRRSIGMGFGSLVQRFGKRSNIDRAPGVCQGPVQGTCVI